MCHLSRKKNIDAKPAEILQFDAFPRPGLTQTFQFRRALAEAHGIPIHLGDQEL